MTTNLLSDLPSLEVLLAELHALTARIAAARAAQGAAATRGPGSADAQAGSKSSIEPGTRKTETTSTQSAPALLQGEPVAAGMDNPPSISAEELHRYILEAHRLGNLVQHKFLILLLAIQRGEYFRLLGFTSIHHYAEQYFQIEHTSTYKSLEVAEAFERLPGITEAFDRGQIGWSILMEVVSVATPQTEGEWLRFVRGKTVRQVKLEVKDAINKKRHRPRKRTYGLPGLELTVNFKLKPEEHAMVQKALAKVALETGRCLGGKSLTPQEALVFLAKRTLETGLPGEDGRVDLESSPFTILYFVCPDCGTAHLSTRDGPVEIPREVVDRVEGEARKVVIPPEGQVAMVPGEAVTEDQGVEEPGEAEVSGGAPEEGRAEIQKDKPNTPALRLRALLRAGNTCENPMCGRTLGLHCHHLIFRSKGGPTCLENTACVCPGCHACVHLGYLKVWRDGYGQLHWEPRGDQFRSEFEAAAEAVKALPVVITVKSPAAHLGSPSQVETTCDVRDSERSECARPASNAARGECARAEAGTPPAEAPIRQGVAPKQDLPRKHDLTVRPLRSIVGALRNLGWTACDAKERVLGALEFFESQGKEPSEEALLKKALAFRF